MVDTGLRPVYVKQTLDQANEYYNQFLASSTDKFNKCEYKDAAGLKDDTTLLNDFNIELNHYKYVDENIKDICMMII